MNKKLLWGLGIGALIFAAYRASALKSGVEYFQYSLSGLKFKISNLLQPEIIFSLQVYNPNTVKIPMNDFFGVIKNDAGQTLANFQNVTPVEIEARATSTVAVSCKVSALSVIMQIIQGKKIASLMVDGILKTSMFNMPIQKTVSLSALSGTENNIGRLNRLMEMKKKSMIRPVVRYGGFLNYAQTI